MVLEVEGSIPSTRPIPYHSIGNLFIKMSNTPEFNTLLATPSLWDRPLFLTFAVAFVSILAVALVPSRNVAA